MRIYFNINKNITDIISYIKECNIDIEIFDSCIENSINFIFKGSKYYLHYDINSEKNKSIYNFTCESHSSNDGEETIEDMQNTRILYNEIKKYIKKIYLEEDQ